MRHGQPVRVVHHRHSSFTDRDGQLSVIVKTGSALWLGASMLRVSAPGATKCHLQWLSLSTQPGGDGTNSVTISLSSSVGWQWINGS